MTAFLGEGYKGRESLIIEANTRTAFRKGDWLMIPPYEGQAINQMVNIELGNSPNFQLYNLKDDIGQQNNLAETYPEKLNELLIEFETLRGGSYSQTEELILK